MTNASQSRRGGRLRKWLLRGLVAVISVVVLAGFLRVVLFAGPVLPVEALPDRLIIDLHCHTAGLGAGGSGCFVSSALRENFRFDIYLKSFGTTAAELEARGDALVIERIAERVRASEHLDGAVVLAMDGVVDDAGELDQAATEFYVPNEFVARETARYPELLFGASVNPYRHDALERLVAAKEAGAVLVKWLPSVMRIDPADERLTPFYEKLVELNLPLLTHGGAEKSFTHAHNELADPMRLKLPLELGVRVVVAHMASTGENENEEDFVRLSKLFADHPNLHADISSLTQLNKPGYLRRTLEQSIARDRLLYGTDYPLIETALVSPWYFPLNLEVGEMRRLAAVENPFERDVQMKRALGVPAATFARTAEFLGIEEIPAAVE